MAGIAPQKTNPASIGVAVEEEGGRMSE